MQVSAIELAHIAERSRKSQSNFRASECRAELVRAMPSAAENLKAIFVQASAIELAHIAERSRKSQSNFRASECRAELVRAMPSAAEFSCKRVQ